MRLIYNLTEKNTKLNFQNNLILKDKKIEFLNGEMKKK